MISWTLVVPVKGTEGAKSRLGASTDQALAIALDTVEVACSVAPVVVVTVPAVSAAFRALGASVVDDPGTGLVGAVRLGICRSGGGPVACLQGDLPALRADELSRALDAASAFSGAFVPDRVGTGTVLIAASHAGSHSPAFGSNSARAHAAAGYVRLNLDDINGLRSDVDSIEDLRALGPLVGPRTITAFGISTS